MQHVCLYVYITWASVEEFRKDTEARLFLSETRVPFPCRWQRHAVVLNDTKVLAETTTKQPLETRSQMRRKRL
ncbi:hypothetical protein RLOC_00011037 [Lonchura striata]|uniref:Uncharacterized protein n=1 Tax=Lonchura striata TaxID=40157 RepID=A0A218VDK1_9PASE|nr:hypothetical protein RLOC_00011037 [Lonchura striata domestica]